MNSSSAAAPSLTADQLATIREQLKLGKHPTVYIRDAVPTLGLMAGASARVLTVQDSTLVIKPAGVDDELPYEADELRATKAEPKPAPRPRRAKKPIEPSVDSQNDRSDKATGAPRKQVATNVTAGKPGTTNASASPNPAPAKSIPVPAKSAPSSAKSATGPAAADVAKTPVPAATSRSGRAARSPKAPQVSVMIASATPDQWTVTVNVGARKGKPAPIAADAVDRAVAELGDDAASTAVASVLDIARAHAADRVAQLAAELEQAQRALRSLGQ